MRVKVVFLDSNLWEVTWKKTVYLILMRR